MNRETGSLIYEEKDGSLLLAEADAMSKQVEEFPYFRPVDGEAQTAQIKTVDGVKQKVLETAREYDRMLYHTRLSLKFNEPAGQVKWLFYCPAGSNNNSLQMIQLMLTYLRIPATKLYSLLIPVFVSILNLNILIARCFSHTDK